MSQAAVVDLLLEHATRLSFHLFHHTYAQSGHLATSLLQFRRLSHVLGVLRGAAVFISGQLIK